MLHSPQDHVNPYGTEPLWNEAPGSPVHGVSHACAMAARSRNYHLNRKPVGRGGESGIRTHGTLLTYTRFPSVRLKPLGHLSSRYRFSACLIRWLCPMRAEHITNFWRRKRKTPYPFSPATRLSWPEGRGVTGPSSARRGTRSAGSRPCRTGACAFCLPSAFPAACACARWHRHNILPSRPWTWRQWSHAQ